MKRILMIIGAGILQVPAIKIAKEMGLLTLVTDYNPEAPGMKIADFPVVMSTRDVDGTVRIAKEFAKKRRIDGVITVGTDASLTVAAVQNALDLPGNRIDVAEATTHKVKMRERLKKHNVPEPEFYPCWSYDDVKAASEKLGFPFVIKPVDNMGARGVMKVTDTESLRFAYERAKNASPRGELIAESYMEGPELSIDALVWNGKIFITGVADRIIEFPPYFVETGHIMPTNLDKKLVNEGIEVFKKGIRALGIEIGAAKGDIKITQKGAMVGEIASRLSGGFMSAYTYPYSSGVNLIKAAIRIALGQDPGDLTPKYNLVAVERAIIPGSGVIKKIEGIEEALNIEGVKNVFITCSVGQVIHIPTSNVEKCGHVIAVGKTREEALAKANLGVKTVKITLGNEGELNHGLIRKNSLEKLEGICSVCIVCDGRACAGRIPGIGGIGNGEGFRRNVESFKKYFIKPQLLKSTDNINTGTNIFGIPLDLPVILSPISGMKRNFNRLYGEKDYNIKVLKGARKGGTIGCIVEIEDEGNDFSYITNPIKEVSGYGIPFLNPSGGEFSTIKNLEKLLGAGARLCGLTIDLTDLKGAAIVDEKSLKRIISRSPVPIVIRGILSIEDALKAVGAGASAIFITNRGGRILESLPATIDMLPEIKEAVGNEALIILDGGIRSGEDVFKALAMGADIVGIGRPAFIYLAGGDEEGIELYLQKIKDELSRTMMIAGIKTIKEIQKNTLFDEELKDKKPTKLIEAI